MEFGGGRAPTGGGAKAGGGNGYHSAPRSSNYAAAAAAAAGGSSSSSSDSRGWTSWLVPMIVVANIAMFIIVMYYNNCPSHPPTDNAAFGSNSCVAGFLGRLSFQPTRENPLLGPSASTLDKLGALVWEKVVHQNQAWRLVSCMWLHAGLVHLFANMLSLLFIGIRLEQQFGFVRIGIVYLVSGFGGSVLSSLFIHNSISVGASGALFGLLGAMLSELITNWTIYSNKAAAFFTLLLLVVVNLAIGILPHVDNFAHIGGFFTGLLLGFVLLMRPQFGWMERHSLPPPYTSRVKSKYMIYQYVFLMVALILVIAGFVVGLIMLFHGKNLNDSCSWCHYLNCVPTSAWSCDV